MTFDEIKEELQMSLTVARGSFYKKPEFGHRFGELKNAVSCATTRRKCESYAVEALQWMIDYKHLKSVTAIAAYQPDDRLLLHVEATAYTGNTVEFERIVEVSDVR